MCQNRGNSNGNPNDNLNDSPTEFLGITTKNEEVKNALNQFKKRLNRLVVPKGSAESKDKEKIYIKTIMLTGSTGAGKSELAKKIHDYTRKGKKIITVSAPNLQKELLESELFGHAEGAFTNAIKDKKGAITSAGDGTVFIDEIADLDLNAQKKLLGIFNDGKYHRLGEPEKEQTCKAQLIFATNKHLADLTARKEFLEDLYYRIFHRSIVFHVPDLLERNDDLYILFKDAINEYKSQDFNNCNIDIDFQEGTISSLVTHVRKYENHFEAILSGNYRTLCIFVNLMIDRFLPDIENKYDNKYKFIFNYIGKHGADQNYTNINISVNISEEEFDKFIEEIPKKGPFKLYFLKHKKPDLENTKIPESVTEPSAANKSFDHVPDLLERNDDLYILFKDAINEYKSQYFNNCNIDIDFQEDTILSLVTRLRNYENHLEAILSGNYRTLCIFVNLMIDRFLPDIENKYDNKYKFIFNYIGKHGADQNYTNINISVNISEEEFDKFIEEIPKKDPFELYFLQHKKPDLENIKIPESVIEPSAANQSFAVLLSILDNEELYIPLIDYIIENSKYDELLEAIRHCINDNKHKQLIEDTIDIYHEHKNEFIKKKIKELYDNNKVYLQDYFTRRALGLSTSVIDRLLPPGMKPSNSRAVKNYEGAIQRCEKMDMLDDLYIVLLVFAAVNKESKNKKEKIKDKKKQKIQENKKVLLSIDIISKFAAFFKAVKKSKEVAEIDFIFGAYESLTNATDSKRISTYFSDRSLGWEDIKDIINQITDDEIFNDACKYINNISRE